MFGLLYFIVFIIVIIGIYYLFFLGASRSSKKSSGNDTTEPPFSMMRMENYLPTFLTPRTAAANNLINHVDFLKKPITTTEELHQFLATIPSDERQITLGFIKSNQNFEDLYLSNNRYTKIIRLNEFINSETSEWKGLFVNTSENKLLVNTDVGLGPMGQGKNIYLSYDKLNIVLLVNSSELRRDLPETIAIIDNDDSLAYMYTERMLKERGYVQKTDFFVKSTRNSTIENTLNNTSIYFK